MAPQGLSRVALVKCVSLARKGDNEYFFQEMASVTVKVHQTLGFESFIESVTLRTQRHAALWHDSGNWSFDGHDWRRQKDVDVLFHLREVFWIAQQYCESGVRRSMLLWSITHCLTAHDITLK